MDDSLTCKQKCSCSSEGTSVKNTQRGGSRNVTVVLPTPPPGKPTCSIGFHSIGFHCPSSCSSTTQATSVPSPFSLASSSAALSPMSSSSTPASTASSSSTAASSATSSPTTSPVTS